LGVLNWFDDLFSEFLQESEFVGILVFHTSTPCFDCLTLFSFWEVTEVYAACKRPTCVYTCPTFGQPVHTLAVEVSVACLSSENIFLKERQSSSSLSEVILLRGFLDLVLVSVVAVCSLGITSD
jgi:hypothetical protein